MPIYRSWPEQPALPSRSSSVPPMHLHSPRPAYDFDPATCLPSVEEPCTPTKPIRPNALAWSCFPRHVRHLILAHALVPDGPGTPVVIGLSEHYAHLVTVAVPIFLALGSWNAYIGAASIYYEHVHIDFYLFPISTKLFLSSLNTLHPRTLVARIQIRLATEENMRTFESGYTIASSYGRHAKINVPTTLRSMKLLGRLTDVEFLIRTGFNADSPWREDAWETESGSVFSMARISLASWITAGEEQSTRMEMSDGDLVGYTKVEKDAIAPAFLGSQSFQSGVLPLLESSAFEKATLNVEYWDGDGKHTMALCVDRDAFVRFWIGATVAELLEIPERDNIWASTRSLPLIYNRPDDEVVACVAELDTSLLDAQEAAISRETRHELVSSPIAYQTSTSGSDVDSSSEVKLIDLSARHHEPQPPDAHLDDGDASSEEDTKEFVRELHERFGPTPRHHSSENHAGLYNSIAPLKDENSSISGGSDGSEISPAVHLKNARTDLLATLTAAVAKGDTMEAITRAAADRQLTSYSAPEGVYKHEDTFPDCSMRQCIPEDSSNSSSEDEGRPRTPACKDPHTDIEAVLPESGQDNERGQDIQMADLSLIEGVFGARSENVTNAPETDTNYQETTPSGSAHKQPASSNPPAKSKKTRPKGHHDGSPKAASTSPEEDRAAMPANNRPSKKRNSHDSATDGSTGSSRTKRRKRARAYKEKQLKLAKRIEAEAAERERTLVN